MDDAVRLEVHDRAAWREWLTEHHATVPAVWLVYRKGAPDRSLTYDESVEEALCFGWVDGLVRGIDDDRYMRRFTPRRPKSKWSASNKERVARLIERGAMAPPGSRVVEAAKADGSWDLIPDAERQWSMPAELEEALAGDPEASEAFRSLSDSHRRAYVRWVASAQRETTRRRRATKALDMLRRGDRPS